MKPDSIFLQAFQGTNKIIPIWFMRQAGRYLPEYQKIKERHSMEAMFRSPSLVSKITCLPIEILDVDAAILFADILTLPAHMGFQIYFDKELGPVIKNPIQSLSDLEQIHPMNDIPYLRQAIQQIKEELPAHVPLLGFAGSPFTVLCYLLEGGSSTHFNKTFQFAMEHPAVFHKLMTILTRNTITYLNLQKESGIQAFQLFDTWGGILREHEYSYWVLPYVQEIFKKVDLPSIYYLKNSSHLLSAMEQCGADFLSVCQTVSLETNPILRKTKKGIQGNLFNGLLYLDQRILETEVLTILKGTQKYKKYIFNLSHGVFPDIKVDTLKFIVDQVHGFKRS